MNDDIYSAYVEAGALAKRFREEAAAMVVPGASILELVDTIEQAILDEGAGIAFPLNISPLLRGRCGESRFGCPY